MMTLVYKVKKSISDYLYNKGKKMPEDIEHDDLLHRKTLQVYWYLLTHGTRGIREIQKDLNISSPSSVSYQINKLIKAGIVSKNEESEKYFVNEKIKSGLLGFYVRFGYRMIPRFTLYLIIYLVGLFGFLIVMLSQGDQFILNPINIFFLFYLVFGIAVFIYESIKIWNMKPT